MVLAINALMAESKINQYRMF